MERVVGKGSTLQLKMIEHRWKVFF